MQLPVRWVPRIVSIFLSPLFRAAAPYSPECVEGQFRELRPEGVRRSSGVRSGPTLPASAFACSRWPRGGASSGRVPTPVLGIVGNGDPGVPALLVDGDRGGREARVRERPDGNGDTSFVPFPNNVEDRRPAPRAEGEPEPSALVPDPDELPCRRPPRPRTRGGSPPARRRRCRSCVGRRGSGRRRRPSVLRGPPPGADRNCKMQREPSWGLLWGDL